MGASFQRVPMPLSNGLYISETPPVSLQECKNMYVNIPDTEGISPAQLFPAPGLVELASSGDTAINRGALVLQGEPYFVNGERLVRLESDLTITDLGEIPGDERVSLAENGEQLIIVKPGTGLGYVYDNTNGLQQITDPSFTANGNSEIVVFIDGYFVHTTASRKFFISALNDGLTYSALDFGTAEADPDIIRSAFVYKNQLFIFGSETVEVFQNIGGAGFPFQRIQGFIIPKGISFPFSVAAFDGTFCWIGQGVNESPKIYKYNGSGNPDIISSTSIDFFIQQEASEINLGMPPDSDAIFVWTYTFRGATFIGWNGTDATLVYDAKASRLAGNTIWHRRESRGVQQKNRWRVNSIVTAYGRLLVGDSESGIIGEIDNDVSDEYGIRIERQFGIPTIHNGGAPVYFEEIELFIDSGQTPANQAEGAWSMRYTDDARNFTNERIRKGGQTGEFSKKLRWFQLGYSERYRIFEFKTDDPQRWVVMGVLVKYNAERRAQN